MPLPQDNGTSSVQSGPREQQPKRKKGMCEGTCLYPEHMCGRFVVEWHDDWVDRLKVGVQPYYLHSPNDDLPAFAGLYARWLQLRHGL